MKSRGRMQSRTLKICRVSGVGIATEAPRKHLGSPKMRDKERSRCAVSRPALRQNTAQCAVFRPAPPAEHSTMSCVPARPPPRPQLNELCSGSAAGSDPEIFRKHYCMTQSTSPSFVLRASGLVDPPPADPRAPSSWPSRGIRPSRRQ